MSDLTIEQTITDYFGWRNFEKSRRFAKGQYSTKPLEEALAYFQNPEKKFKSIHVAGTVGKGSVTHYLSQLIAHENIKCGRYTSPHLLNINERFAIGHENITNTELTNLWQKLVQYPMLSELSWFDAITLMAFIWFSENECEWCVIETGLGGRLDSTNVLDSKIAVLTRIDEDHKAILGDTIAEIAREKAGIIKNGSQVFTLEQMPDAMKEIQKRCHQLGLQPQVYYSQEDFAKLNASFSKFVFSRVFNKAPDRGFGFAPIPGRLENSGKISNLLFDSAHNNIGLKNLSLFLLKNYPSQTEFAFYINSMRERNLKEMAVTIKKTFEEFKIPEIFLFEISKEGFYAGSDDAALAEIQYAAPETLVPLWKRPGITHIVCGSMYLYAPYKRLLEQI